MGLMLMQQKKPKIEAKGDAKVVQNDDLANDADTNDADTNVADSNNDEADGDAGSADQDDSEAENSDDKNEDIATVTEPEKFYQLGSLDGDSTDRMLATFTSHGGAIKNVEYNFRKKRNNKFAYRDLENKGGYLGNLQLERSNVGNEDEENIALTVRFVGKSTPADDAGILLGDKITKAISSAEDATEFATISPDSFYEYLATKTKPGQTLDLQIWRDGIEQSITVTLTEKPIEIIRPEPDNFEQGIPSPESFLMTLRKPDGIDWPEIDPGMINSTWDAAETNVNGLPAIEFSYTISTANLKKVGLDGPVKISRTFWLPEVTEEERFDISARKTHIKTRIKIENQSETEQEIGFQLNGATGTPTEGWWYTMKIHGRSTAVGYMAGSRDVASSTEQNSYKFFGGPEIVKNVSATRPKMQWLAHDDPETKLINFLSVDTQYYNVSLLPAESETNSEWPYACESAIAAVSGGKVPEENKKLARLADCTFLMFDSVKLAANETYTQDFDIFVGPKEPKTLKAYGLDSKSNFRLVCDIFQAALLVAKNLLRSNRFV